MWSTVGEEGGGGDWEISRVMVRLGERGLIVDTMASSLSWRKSIIKERLVCGNRSSSQGVVENMAGPI